MHLVYFETYATRYSVTAARIVGKPDLLLYAFGLCGAALAANIAAVDREPNNFEDYCEMWNHRTLSETDSWVGFMVLRHLLGYAVAFDALPPFLQREALCYTIEQHHYERDEDTTPSKVVQFPHLAHEVESWPSGWQRQLQPIRDDLGLAVTLR